MSPPTSQSELVARASERPPPGLQKSDLLRMHRMMLAARLFDQKMLTIQRQGRIAFYLGGFGEEATHVGSSMAMGPTDWILPHYRGASVPLVLGVTFRELIEQCLGNSRDPSKGHQMPVHYGFAKHRLFSISAPIATQIPQAVGVAHGMKVRGAREATMVGFGDGSSSEGDFHVAMNWAGVFRLPVVFVLDNNQWAISVPSRMQTASHGYAIKAQAYGFPGIQVDGNDVVAVYEATRDAAERAKDGQGPTLIECLTYRMSSHSSSDEHERYVPRGEVDAWKARDPIATFEVRLGKWGFMDSATAQALRSEIADEIDFALKEAEQAPPPGIDTLVEDVYGEIPPRLARQMDELRLESERS